MSALSIAALDDVHPVYNGTYKYSLYLGTGEFSAHHDVEVGYGIYTAEGWKLEDSVNPVPTERSVAIDLYLASRL